MWVEELTLENIKCFDKLEITFGSKKEKYPWITLLGENGGGKSTILQALGLLLAGPEGAGKLLNNPEGWLQDEENPGKIGIHIHQGKNDPGKYVEERVHGKFSYNYLITGSKRLAISVGKNESKVYTEPAIVEGEDNKRRLSWLRENALLPKGDGWFAAGYGAFRRLDRKGGKILLPSMQAPLRYTNFLTQFEEDMPLTAFEQWMVYLDYQISKNGDAKKTALHQRDMGIYAINKLLPRGSHFDKVDESGNGKIWFIVDGVRVPTIALSDGYRSILAFAGDLVWRLIEAFPKSKNPLEEEGVVLIDELDIHVHPAWQRQIPSLLQGVFKNIQFIVATHSPLIAAGAGKEAITYRLSRNEEGAVEEHEIKNLAFKDVDNILRSPAFELASTFSIDAEDALQVYLQLKHTKKRSSEEEKQFKQYSVFAKEIFAPSGDLQEEDRQLREEMATYIKSKLSK